MKFPTGTPRDVQLAVRRYVRARRTVAVRALAALGLAASGLTTLAFLVADRFWEAPALWRAAAPWVAAAPLATAAVAAAAFLVLYRPRALATAIRLDQAFPDNRDRWGTALDLLLRRQAGEGVGAAECVERLLQETAGTGPSRRAGTLVSRRLSGWALLCCLVVGLGFAFLWCSAFFDVPLLWERLWHPGRNLPRDSLVEVRVVAVNERPLDEGRIEPVPENSPFSLVVSLARRPVKLWTWRRKAPATKPCLPGEFTALYAAPAMEVRSGGGVEAIPFRSVDAVWRATRARLPDSMRFRVRAGDALTAWLSQDVIERIRIAAVDYSLRLPRYVRHRDVSRRPLEASRLSALAESDLELIATCDQPFVTLEATFEAIQEARAETRIVRLPNDIMGNVPFILEYGNQKGGLTRPRPLRIKALSPESGRLRLRVEENGILRLRAVGANGIPSVERVCLIEASQDAPPRLSLAGIEPDMWIFPGDVIPVQYRAEDDYGVADLYMLINPTDIPSTTMEVFVPSGELGQKVVAGQELIQRMRYQVYRNAPLTVRFVASDYKGQESRSEEFRVHLLGEDYSARFARGMAVLDAIASHVQSCRQTLAALSNQVNIAEAAAGAGSGGGRTAGPSAALERLRKAVQGVAPPLAQADALASGELPCRLVESGSLLAIAGHVLHGRESLLAEVEEMGSGKDVPGALRRLREKIAANGQLTAAWARAVEAERARFRPEAALQQARKLRQDVEAIVAVAAGRRLQASNIGRVMEQVPALVAALEPLSASVEGLATLQSELTRAKESGDGEALARALRSATALLDGRTGSPSAELRELAVAAARELAAEGGLPSRAAELLGAMARVAGDQEFHQPAAVLALARGWLGGLLPDEGEWYFPRASLQDAWLTLDALRQAIEDYRLAILSGRYAHNTRERDDREAEIREMVLAAADLVRGIRDADDGLRQGLLAALQPFSRDRFSYALDRPADDRLEPLNRILRDAQRRLKPEAMANSLGKDVALLAGGLRRLADGYDRSAKEVEDLLPRPAALATDSPDQKRLASRAASLQAEAEALEVVYRALLFNRVYAGLAVGRPAVDWAAWEPLHACQRELASRVALRAEALTASHRTGPGRGQESQMGAGPDWGKKYGVVAGNTRRFAEKLRSVASDVEGAFAGKPVPDEGGDPDGAAYLGVLKQEFRTLTPFLARSDRKAMEAAREAILESEAGRVGMNGAVLLRLLGDRATLASAKGGSCKAALAELKSLGATLAAQGGTAALAPVVALTNALGSRGAEQPVASVPGAAALLSELDLQLGEVVEELRTQVDLPPAASLAKTYQRLQGSYQRRWMERMRQGEVGLIRAASVAALLPDPPPEAAARLAAQYARLVEWRARNLYVARRTSAGVDVTARDAGMTMRLPPHIAKEFFRARTRATPEDFRAAIEEYYRDLYRNLSY